MGIAPTIHLARRTQMWAPAAPGPWRAYGVAVGATVVSLLVALALHAALALDLSPLFLAAVMLSAWYGGLGPGLLTTLTSLLVSTYFFRPPPFSLTIATVDTGLELIVFALAAVLISSLNARLRAARRHTEAARRQLLFLAEASKQLTASLDYEATLVSVPRLVVPELADGCAVGLVTDGGSVRWLAAVHHDPAREVVWRTLLDRYPDDPLAPASVRRALRTGQAELVPELSTAVLDAVGPTVEQAILLRHLGAASALVVPLSARQQTVGVLAFVVVGPRRYGTVERALAEELAGRVAAAVDNARLYQEEQAARARAERLAAERAAILHQSADGVVTADPGGHVTFVNPAARRLLGLGAIDSPTSGSDGLPPFFPVEGPSDRPLESPLARAARRGEAVVGSRWRLRRPNGGEVVVQGSAAPVLADNGARLGAVLTLHDVTARRDLERQKDEFFANVSHDLRTPITAIKAAIGALLANEPPATPAPVHELLLTVDEAADRMTRLVNDLLELTRLQAGRVQLRPAPVDLRELAARAGRLIEPLAGTRGQRVVLTLPDERVTALVDAERLERVLLNLLTNAHQHGRDGGAIELRLVRGAGEVRLAVVDDGPGIPEGEQARIFERFYRGRRAAGQRPGSGLGLAIARALVALHGGRLWVDSRPDAGAAFWVALPATEPPASGEEGEEA